MEAFWGDVAKNALIVGLGGVLVAIGNYVVRKLGKNIASHERMCALEDRMSCSEDRHDTTDKAVRTLLSVNRHQTQGIRAVVEASRQSLNGSYDRTIHHLDEADKETDEFLRGNYGGPN